jgi:hypothetical protein
MSASESLQDFARRRKQKPSEAYAAWHAKSESLALAWQKPCSARVTDPLNQTLPHVTIASGRALGLLRLDLASLDNPPERRREQIVY